ncbi:MAG: glycosyltransferase family 4 protein [Thaumarchaeota archaeon]|nr:glycosyltransferase family 4 protein [Nitrososphaerota archaeon]
MKVGLIHPSFKVPGGAEITSTCILEALRRTSHATTLYTVEPPAIEESQNLKVHKIKRGNLPSLWRYQRMKEVRKLFSDASGEDVLVIGSGNLILEKTPVKRIILYCHSTFEAEHEFLKKKFPSIKGAYYRMIQNNLSASFERLRDPSVKLVSNSNFTRKVIMDITGKDSLVIYPPVDIRKFSGWFDSSKDSSVVTLSRFSPEKNLKFAIEVAKIGKFKYTLIGSAKFESQLNLYNELRREAESSNISILPNLPSSDIEKFLGCSKVYFHPSKETFGISVVEAISAGCIPIVPDAFAFLETVPFEQLRFKGSEEAALKIKDALEGKYDHLRQMLKLHIEKFSVENFQSNMLKEIESIN